MAWKFYASGFLTDKTMDAKLMLSPNYNIKIFLFCRLKLLSACFNILGTYIIYSTFFPDNTYFIPMPYSFVYFFLKIQICSYLLLAQKIGRCELGRDIGRFISPQSLNTMFPNLVA